MLRLYYAPRTRAVRVRWLLEELGLPHELIRTEFKAPDRGFSQSTPVGKIPVLEDGEVVMGESGAILEYVLERYGEGRLAPSIGDPDRAEYLQWLHWAEGTGYPPMTVAIFHTRYAGDADQRGDLLDVWRVRSREAFRFAEERIKGRTWIVGEDFTAADIMLGFTLLVGQVFGGLDDDFPGLQAYIQRLVSRPAFQRATVD